MHSWLGRGRWGLFGGRAEAEERHCWGWGRRAAAGATDPQRPPPRRQRQRRREGAAAGAELIMVFKRGAFLAFLGSGGLGRPLWAALESLAAAHGGTSGFQARPLRTPSPASTHSPSHTHDHNHNHKHTLRTMALGLLFPSRLAQVERERRVGEQLQGSWGETGRRLCSTPRLASRWGAWAALTRATRAED
jgi:hypothetical protein